MGDSGQHPPDDRDGLCRQDPVAADGDARLNAIDAFNPVV
jgi:hypothetical protein